MFPHSLSAVPTRHLPRLALKICRIIVTVVKSLDEGHFAMHTKLRVWPEKTMLSHKVDGSVATIAAADRNLCASAG